MSELRQTNNSEDKIFLLNLKDFDHIVSLAGNAVVKELLIFRNNENKNFKECFGDLTENEIKSQVIQLSKQWDDLIQTFHKIIQQSEIPTELSAKFFTTLSDRLDNLITQYCPERQIHAKQDKKAYPNKTAAGVMTYTKINDEVHLLLSKRHRHNWWDHFGGMSNNEDGYLYQTAAREVTEESGGVFKYTPYDLRNCPSHDLLTRHTEGRVFVYRMYLLFHDFVETKLFKSDEHTDFEWVSLLSILKAVQSSPVIKEEDQNTIQVKVEQGSFIIYPPLYRLLQQKPVMSNLNRLALGKSPLNTHTQSVFAPETLSPEMPAILPPTSLHQLRWQLGHSISNHAAVIEELKRKSNYSAAAVATTPLEESSLSQSELHLKLILGNRYQEQNTAENLRQIIDAHLLSELSQEQQTKLIQQLAEMIHTERKNNHNIYFYHACDAKTAFAYTLYSGLYEILRAGNKSTVFRANHQPFTKFKTINEFIAHFSEDGKKEIFNYELGYDDLAISANLFIAGNHDLETSFSIRYFLKNLTRRSLDLKTLLGNFLIPQGVSADQIKRLMNLYNFFETAHGSALYQIAIPKENIKNKAYPAGHNGVLNPYQGENDIATILNLLQQRMTISVVDETLQTYVKRLQARVFVNPEFEFNANKLSLNQILLSSTEEQTEQLHQKMKKMTAELAHTIFSIEHSGEIYPHLDINASMLRIRKNIHSRFFLPPLITTPEMILSQAIINNNKAMILSTLASYPELKNKKIYGHHFKGNDDNLILTIRLMMQYAPEVILDIFTLEELIAYLNENWHVNKFVRMFPLIPQDKQELFMTRLCDKIDNSDIKFAFFSLPKKNRLVFLISIQTKFKINDNIDCFYLETLLKFLCPNEQSAFLISLGKIQNINSFILLVRIAGILSKEIQREMIVLNQDKIQNGNDLYSLTQYLPVIEQSGFIKRHEHKIQTSFEVKINFVFLSPEEQLGFIKRHEHAIKDGFDLSFMLECWPETNRLEFAILHEDNIENARQLHYVLQILPKSNHFTLIKRIEYKIQGEIELIPPYLPQEEQLEFIKRHEHKIEKNGFISLIPYWPQAERLQFIKRHEHKIQNIFLLKKIVPYWLGEEEQLNFIKRHEHLIEDSDGIKELLPYWPLLERPQFIKRHANKIENAYRLAEILKFIPKEEQPEFVKRLEHKINNVKELITVLLSSSRTKRLRIAMDNRHKITIQSQFSEVRSCLPAQDQPLFELPKEEGAAAATAVALRPL